jgi:ABC-type amino acid transport substrate-binding protein
MRNARLNLALALSLVAIILASIALGRSSRNASSGGGGAKVTTQPGLLDGIRRNRVIRVGYGVYPPYTIEDPNTREVSGFSAAVIEEIAKELGCKVEWHRLSFDTMSVDLKRGVYDVIADPIFATIPRAPEFSFSEPYAYFADGIAVVRKTENRFKVFDDLNRPGIKISVGLGQGSEAFSRARLSKPEILPVSVGTDNMLIFSGVLAGRTDAAVADAENAKRFVQAHPNDVKALWLDHPPAFMPAGFALRPGDREGAEFLNVCIRYLRSTGTLETLAQKYGAEAAVLRPQ